MADRRGKPNGRGFTYEVVTSNGAGVHARGFKQLRAAVVAMSAIAEKWPGDTFEIQRVRHLPSGSVQYDMRQGSRWVPWHHKRGIAHREPDLQVTFAHQEATNA